MKSIRIIAIVLAVVFAMVGMAPEAHAGFDVNLNINLDLTPMKVKSDPVVVPILGTLVYLVLDMPEDVLFFGGFWYRQKDGNWYKTDDIRGKWKRVPPGHVPKDIRGLPSGYKKVGPDQPRIKHKELKRNWKKWEKEKHWKNKGGKKGKGGPDSGDLKDAYDKGKKGKELKDKGRNKGWY